MTIAQQQYINVDSHLLDIILEPYRKNCHYLQKAEINATINNQSRSSKKKDLIVSTIGEFSISESCYIDDTGHFNSVEFNICYNQLAYLTLAYCVENDILEAMSTYNMNSFKKYKLSNMLIVHFSSSFRRPISPRCFQGKLTIYNTSIRSNMSMIKTSCAFYDDKNGLAEGEIVLAILNANSDHKYTT
jgi:hypothetical protein